MSNQLPGNSRTEQEPESKVEATIKSSMGGVKYISIELIGNFTWVMLDTAISEISRSEDFSQANFIIVDFSKQKGTPKGYIGEARKLTNILRNKKVLAIGKGFLQDSIIILLNKMGFLDITKVDDLQKALAIIDSPEG